MNIMIVFAGTPLMELDLEYDFLYFICEMYFLF